MEHTKRLPFQRSKNAKKVFGVALARDADQIPFPIKACVEYLQHDGMALEGIFRHSGKVESIQKLKTLMDRGEEPNLIELEKDPHVVAALLKVVFFSDDVNWLYLRELPEPLLTFEAYDMFIAAMSIEDIPTRLKQAKKVLEWLPRGNMLVVLYLVSFLKRVTALANQNKMSPSNIAIVFSPNLLRSRDDDLGIALEDSPYANKLLVLFLEHYDELFKDFSPSPARAPKQVPTPVEPKKSGKVFGNLKKHIPHKKSNNPSSKTDVHLPELGNNNPKTRTFSKSMDDSSIGEKPSYKNKSNSLEHLNLIDLPDIHSSKQTQQTFNSSRAFFEQQQAPRKSLSLQSVYKGLKDPKKGVQVNGAKDFQGQDAIVWLQKTFELEVKECISLCKQLVIHDLIADVKGGSRVFDASAMYKIVE